MSTFSSEWKPEAIDSEDLAAQYRAATELTMCDIPMWLSKQLASLRLKVSNEMARRGMMIPAS